MSSFDVVNSQVIDENMMHNFPPVTLKLLLLLFFFFINAIMTPCISVLVVIYMPEKATSI